MALLVAVMTVACGSSSAAGGTTSSNGFTAAQLCALATPAEVGAALGRSVPAGVPSGVNAPSCTWTAADASAVTIAATDTASVGKLPYGLQNVSGAHVTSIPNLGDAAFFASGGDDSPTAELDMKKGGRAVTITGAVAGGTMTQAQQEAIEKAVAIAAAGRM
ncbi:MAG TPA: hypothetical protein VFL29_07770 [Candidatus Dormibacteraeota bacterium]|nr:hypothetical protein [Candidatus Dormibacteraeota bacterium]